MLAPAKGRLHHHVVGVPHERGITNDRCSRAAEITGEHDRRDAATARTKNLENDDGRAEDVASVEERRSDPRGDLDLGSILGGSKEWQGGPGLRLAVDRFVQVDLQVGRHRPELGLRVRACRASLQLDRLDRGRHVLAIRIVPVGTCPGIRPQWSR